MHDKTGSGRPSLSWGEPLAGAACTLGLAWLIWSNLNREFLAGLDFSVVYDYRHVLLQGLGLTLLLTAVTMVAALAIGVVFAILYRLPFRIIRTLVYWYVEIWRNTPLLVQLFWVHFALPQITGVPMPAYVSGVIAMTLQASAYLTEISRAGIDAIPKGQWEACQALALPRRTVWLTVILPQAFKVMVPPLANTAISFFKGTTVLSLLAVDELMTVTNHISAYTFRPFELLTVAGVVYFLIGSLFSTMTYRLERILKRSER